jgi:amidase
MKVCERNVVYSTHDKDNKPSLCVDPGEAFCVKTQLNTGEWLQSEDDVWHPDKRQGTNLSNCIQINGAEKNDVLAVDILDIQTDEIAYTGFAAWKNPLCRRIIPNDWGIVYKIVKIRNNEILWNDTLRLPLSPMVGTLGVAPAGKAVHNSEAGKHGGNMDIQEARKGTTVYFKVQVSGALLHIGDVHVIMGDGEINRAGGLECRSTVTLKVRLVKAPDGFDWVRMEDSEHIMAAAFHEDMEESFYLATGELLRYIMNAYGLEKKEAYLLLGQVMESRCTAVVNKQKPYICKIKKRYLAPNAGLD